ncbi:Leucine-rich repeat-containing protein 9 [Taenia solium]|eukprot:TsM_000323700 transcript=TsM_000323700 gene=TsM_000323700
MSALQFCRKLTQLYLSENKIENIAGPLTKLTHLTVIDLANNCISSIVGLEAFEHLKHANFARNDLDFLAPVAQAFPNSECLNFSENHIKDPDEILATITYLTCLKSLAIYGNPLDFSTSTVSQFDFEGIIDQFRPDSSSTHPCLKEFLCLPKNVLRPDAADAEVIFKMPWISPEPLAPVMPLKPTTEVTNTKVVNYSNKALSWQGFRLVLYQLDGSAN